MDEKGEIFSSADVDEHLALQIWSKGHSPRLVIFNKDKGTKKLIYLSWVEKRDRKLSISGSKRGQTVSYLIQDFEPAVQDILMEYDVRTNFRIRLWKFAAELEKILHTPETVQEKSEFAMLPEDKRSALWIADCSGEDKKTGVFRPFFPASEAEMAGITEDRMIIIAGGRGMDDLFHTGATRALEKANPARWVNPVRVAAAAMLLGFSYCDADGSEFLETLWTEGSSFTLRDPNIVGLGRKLVAFIRHFDVVDQITAGTSMDSSKDLQAQNYTRKRRLDFQAGAIGDVPYRVTFFENEAEGRMALGCEPRAVTARHKGELVYSFPADVYGVALKNDTIMGSPEDEYYTTTQLVWAKQFKDWYDNVTPYIRGFAGLM